MSDVRSIDDRAIHDGDDPCFSQHEIRRCHHQCTDTSWTNCVYGKQSFRYAKWCRDHKNCQMNNEMIRKD